MRFGRSPLSTRKRPGSGHCGRLHHRSSVLRYAMISST
jgi:hypothetical protein